VQLPNSRACAALALCACVLNMSSPPLPIMRGQFPFRHLVAPFILVCSILLSLPHSSTHSSFSSSLLIRVDGRIHRHERWTLYPMKMDGQPNPADILKQQSEEAAAKEKEREKEKEKQKTKSDGSTGGDESDGKADEDWWLKPGAWNRNRETPFDSFFDNQQSDFDDQDAWGSSWREGQTVLPYPIDLSPGSTSSSNKRRKTLSERIPRVQPDSLDDSSNETLPPPSSSSSSTKLLSPLKANVSVHKLNLFRRFHEDSMDASMQYGHVIRLETPFKHFSFHEPVGGCNATTAQGGKETTSSNARRHKCRVATNAGFFNIQMPPMKKRSNKRPDHPLLYEWPDLS